MNFKETIFLTGFPGFIAARLVRRLADSETRFFLLIQPDFIEKAETEIAETARVKNVPPENFIIVAGDITQVNLGILPESLEDIRSQTTSVFHLAAVYDLAVEKDLAFRVNVEGTKNVNDFVKTLKTLRRYNYISTCYVAGKREGVILETELEHQAGFRNFYEETKYLAEMSVEELKPILPVTIFRPSVVVGDSRTGETAKYDGIYYLIQYVRKFPALLRLINVGNDQVKLNLVPVDFVVEGIAALCFDAAAAGKTIALADPDPLSTEQLFDEIALALTQKKSLLKPPSAIIEKSLLLPVAPHVSGLPLSAVPYFYIAQKYDTDEANRLLARHAIQCPRFSEYIGNLVRFVKEHPRL